MSRHPIITLVGRGGIGKTWLTLSILQEIAKEGRYFAIVWFSARDIDLLPQGPKQVTPHVLTVADIAKEFIKLTRPSEQLTKGFNPIDHFAGYLNHAPVGPILFVFDNFETFRVPVELFNWLDTYIRLPNKILITTRARDFKGDYPIEVQGMSDDECNELIDLVSRNLGITSLLTDSYIREIIQESAGHPYVIKVLLGEVAKAGRVTKVERIVATLDDILDALFERNYVSLSPAARRIFLTLSSWRSTIPVIALEAVVLRQDNEERIDVQSAIQEINRSSFIELAHSDVDEEAFVTVPLVATVFGRRKLATSPMKSAIEADLALLQEFGASQQTEIKHGFKIRMERLFANISRRMERDSKAIDTYLPIIEFLARRHPDGWLLLSQLVQETGSLQGITQAKEYVRRYLESDTGDSKSRVAAWNRLASLCQSTEDWSGEIQALVELAKVSDVEFQAISEAANRVNFLLSKRHFDIDSDERRLVLQSLADVMERRIREGDATDYSRLGWLFIGLRNKYKAWSIAEAGLRIDPNNDGPSQIASMIIQPT